MFCMRRPRAWIDAAPTVTERIAMSRKRAKEYARGLLDKYGLSHVNVRIGRAKRELGRAVFSKGKPHTMILSRYLIDLNPWPEVKNTILHELAHFLAGPRAGHGPLWKKKAKELGARLESRTSKAVMPPLRWELYCHEGKHQITTYSRKPKGSMALCYCQDCGLESVGMLELRDTKNVTS